VTLWYTTIKSQFVALICIGLLLVLAASYTSAQTYETMGSALGFWHAVLTGAILFVLMGTYWLRSASHAYLVPRLWLISLFVAWVLTLYMQSNPNDIATAYYGALLETPALLFLSLLVAWRIVRIFVPLYHISWWQIGIIVVLVLPVFILVHTNLNQSLIITNGSIIIYPEVMAWYAKILAGSLVLAAVLLMHKGRRPDKSETQLSIPNLTFSPAVKGRDINLLDAAHDVVQQTRRIALKRGKWVSFRRSLFMSKGIIVSDPVALRAALTELCLHALRTTPDNAIVLEVVANPEKTIVHAVVRHSQSTKPATWAERSFQTEVVALGAAATITQVGTDVAYVLSWPLEF